MDWICRIACLEGDGLQVPAVAGDVASAMIIEGGPVLTTAILWAQAKIVRVKGKITSVQAQGLGFLIPRLRGSPR